jgi:hypothetical protein
MCLFAPKIDPAIALNFDPSDEQQSHAITGRQWVNYSMQIVP